MTPEALAELMKVRYIGLFRSGLAPDLWHFTEPVSGTTISIYSDDATPTRTLAKEIRRARRAFGMNRLKVQADNGDMAAMKELWRREAIEGKG